MQQHAAVPQRRLLFAHRCEKASISARRSFAKAQGFGAKAQAPAASIWKYRRAVLFMAPSIVPLRTRASARRFRPARATSWISRAPASAVFASTPKMLEPASDSASPTLPCADSAQRTARRWRRPRRSPPAAASACAAGSSRLRPTPAGRSQSSGVSSVCSEVTRIARGPRSCNAFTASRACASVLLSRPDR